MPPARRVTAALRTLTLVTLLLLVANIPLRPAPLHAQMCEQQGLAVCSYGKYYSGTITWKSTLTLTGDISGVLKGEVTATVDRGRVSCTGQTSEDKQIKSQRTTYAARGTISGVGLIVVDKPSSSPTDKRGTYKIEVACPTPATTWTAKGPNQSNSGSTTSDPADFKGGEYMVTTEEHPTPDFALLAGSETYEHPDTDPANGVTGTFTVKWQLSSKPLVVKAVPGGPDTVGAGRKLGSVPDPCQLLTAAEIASALGSAPSRGKAIGPLLDEDTGAKVSECTMAVGKVKLTITVGEFPTSAVAGKALTAMAEQDPDDAEAAKMTAEPGLGERAIWGATSAGAIWIALKGKYLLNVTLAGDVGDGVRYREPLKRLASLALAKL